MSIQVDQLTEEELIELDRNAKRERERRVIERQFGQQVQAMEQWIASHKEQNMTCYMGNGDYKILLTPGRRDALMTLFKGML